MGYLDKIKQVIELLDDIDDRFKAIPDRQSELDSKISDIYHYIENNRITSKNSYRLIKELKNVLLERRNLKQEQSVLHIFENEKGKLNLDTNRKMLLNDVCRENNNYNKEYRYRQYDEEEFVNRMEG